MALFRWVWRGEGEEVGPSETEMLVGLEVNAQGDATGMFTFDPDDVDAAYAELDARFEASLADEPSAVPGSMRDLLLAMKDRDWDEVRANCAPGFSIDDRRRLGLGGLWQGVDTLIESQRALAELSPDASYRVDHTRVPLTTSSPVT